ncbi:MAG: hypothetical protein ACREN6_11330 [Gemmatimonadaceae bacterium]
MRDRNVLLAAAVGVALVVACGDPYQHTNPYDPVFPVTITVTGPDTIYNSFEIANYSVQSVPAFPDTAVSWASLGLASSGGTGAFQATGQVGQPLWPDYDIATVTALIGKVDTTEAISVGSTSLTIQTSIWRHSGAKSVVVTQRLTRIQLRCPDTHACDTLGVGGTWSVWVDGFDAHNLQIYALVSATLNPPTGKPIAVYTSRDPTIASVSPVGIRAANVTALKVGTTWIVGTRIAAQDTLIDSLQVTVH